MRPQHIVVTATMLALAAHALPAHAVDPTAPVGTAMGSLIHPGNITGTQLAEATALAREKVIITEAGKHGFGQKEWFQQVTNWANKNGINIGRAFAIVGEIAGTLATSGVSVLGTLLGPSEVVERLMDDLRGIEPTPDTFTDTDTDGQGPPDIGGEGHRADGWQDVPGWLDGDLSSDGVMDDGITGDLNADDWSDDPDHTLEGGGNSAGGVDDYGDSDLRDDSNADGYGWYTEDGAEEGYGDDYGDDDDDDDDGGAGPEEDGTNDWLISATAGTASQAAILWDVTGPMGEEGCLAEVYGFDADGTEVYANGWSDDDCATALGAATTTD